MSKAQKSKSDKNKKITKKDLKKLKGGEQQVQEIDRPDIGIGGKQRVPVQS